MIQITDKIRITRLDKLNLQLEVLEPVNKKDGTVAYEWKGNGYYGDLKSAIGGVLKHCLMELATEDITSLSELIERIDNIDKELKGAIKNVRNEN
jgi:hypothetical protein